jgi:hypothetical protein
MAGSSLPAIDYAIFIAPIDGNPLFTVNLVLVDHNVIAAISETQAVVPGAVNTTLDGVYNEIVEAPPPVEATPEPFGIVAGLVLAFIAALLFFPRKAR